MDIAPEAKEVKEFVVQASAVRGFCTPEVSIRRGERLYSMWYDASEQQWTSQLYPCTAREDYPDQEEPESVVVRVLFDEDPRVYIINVQWVVQT